MDPLESIAAEYGGEENPSIDGTVPDAPQVPKVDPIWKKLFKPTKKTPDDFNGSIISTATNKLLGKVHGHDGGPAEDAQVGQSAELCLDAVGGASGPGIFTSPAFYLGRSMVAYVRKLKELQ